MIETGDPIRSAAHTRPAVRAIHEIEADAYITYGRLDELVDRVVGYLAEQGVRPDDRVVLCPERSIETIVTIHAIRRIGAIVVPIDTDLSTDRLQDRCERVSATLVLGNNLPTLPVPTAAVPDSTRLPPVSEPSVIGRVGDDVVCCLFTSGTTGTAKIVPLPATNLRASALASATRLGSLPSDRWISPLKPVHMGGFAPIIRTALSGTGLVLTPGTPDGIESAISDAAGSQLSVVPTMLEGLLSAAVPLDALRVVLVGGARTPPSLVESALDAGVPVHVSYGMTETASQIATATPDQLARNPHTVGRPVRGAQVSIDGTENSTMNSTEMGEIVVAGPMVMAGYLDENSRVGGNGRIRTGDRGYLDADGFLHVEGRVDDRIITGGATVDPWVVADAIESDSDVESAFVLGVPNATWGEIVGALVVPSAGSTPTPESIETAVGNELTTAEQPRLVAIVDEVPRTDSGTVDRERARSILAATSMERE